ncbi:unnamed protein product [Microthlaspi erraticum]|uniref:Bifunctional inhibitor/plant lipid transfer protein/seed storage helical domain-containing protein n=1 Tax=Microthlaspi erraticum TaxID=1685480 RepID=A0A6D2IJP3_9BRAS|nr:unnamed protein product [Microthlaspi erraticum]
MANKLFLVSATLALFFLLTNASIYRTIVEFEDAATNPKGPKDPQQKIKECRKEFQQSKHLVACQEWIRKQAMQQGGGGQPLDGDFDFYAIENPMGPQQRPPLLQQCCNELHQEEEACVCPTLKRAAKAVRSQGQHAPQQVSSIFQTAKHLPRVCEVQRVSVCPFDKAPPLFPPYY